jgi:hypothetical protein
MSNSDSDPDYIELNIDNKYLEVIGSKAIYLCKDKYKQINPLSLKKYNLNKSTIIKCYIYDKFNNIISKSLKYRKILLDIFELLNINEIIKNMEFNKIGPSSKAGTNGFVLYKKRKYKKKRKLKEEISIQFRSTKKILEETIHFCKIYNYGIFIVIKLENNDYIYIHESYINE